MDAARTALIGIRPGGPSSADASDSAWTGDDTGGNGAQLPALSAMDMLSLVGVVTPPTASALKRWVDFNSAVAVRADAVNGDGTLIPVMIGSASLSAKDYLAGFTAADRKTPWLRAPTPDGLADASTTFTVWMPDRNIVVGNEPALYAFVKQLVADYTRVCDAVAFAIQAAPAGGAQTSSDDASVRNFWSMLGSLCSTLDVLQENPPASPGAAVAGALQAALHTTEEFIGKSIAAVSAEAGKAAGNIAHGFFDNAGILSVVVAGIAIFLFLK